MGQSAPTIAKEDSHVALFFALFVSERVCGVCEDYERAVLHPKLTVFTLNRIEFHADAEFNVVVLGCAGCPQPGAHANFVARR
jgi:hypothetical protein